MRCYIVKENHIVSAVIEIIRYIQTYWNTSFYFMSELGATLLASMGYVIKGTEWLEKYFKTIPRFKSKNRIV